MSKYSRNASSRAMTGTARGVTRCRAARRARSGGCPKGSATARDEPTRVLPARCAAGVGLLQQPLAYSRVDDSLARRWAKADGSRRTCSELPRDKLPGTYGVAQDGLLIALPVLMKLIYWLAVIAVSAGCGRSAVPVQPESAASLQGGSQAQNTAELRHFYLLSPGPNATLVVTRSDLASR